MALEILNGFSTVDDLTYIKPRYKIDNRMMQRRRLRAAPEVSICHL
jgi:hypothetical protein